MGAEVECRDGRLPPLVVRGSELRGIDYEMPIASAQVKSCLLFAGLLADGATTVRESQPSRDHSERMLAAAGAGISREGGAITVEPAERLEAGDIAVPGDFSSAAFFIAAALIVPGSEVSLRGVGINRSRIGLLSILARMGVEMGGAHEAERAMVIQEIREPGPEPMASLRVRSAQLQGAEVGAEDVPGAIDELPLVALLGCFAEGETVLSGAEELRRKESDRIDAVVEGLGALGAEIEGRPDGFVVTGTGGLRGGAIDARGDHRMAMLGAIAGLASREGVEVDGMESAAVSYPGFEPDLRALLCGLERALEQDHVEPLALELAVALVGADDAEAARLEQADAAARSGPTPWRSACAAPRPRRRLGQGARQQRAAGALPGAHRARRRRSPRRCRRSSGCRSS